MSSVTDLGRVLLFLVVLVAQISFAAEAPKKKKKVDLAPKRTRHFYRTHEPAIPSSKEELPVPADHRPERERGSFEAPRDLHPGQPNPGFNPANPASYPAGHNMIPGK